LQKLFPLFSGSHVSSFSLFFAFFALLLFLLLFSSVLSSAHILTTAVEKFVRTLKQAIFLSTCVNLLILFYLLILILVFFTILFFSPDFFFLNFFLP
jgi:uncharacterized BrkB/YihY/UPF0761 family membrane protein